MSLHAVEYNKERLFTETCYKCCIYFAISESLYNERLRDGGSFYCPNGHGQHYTDSDEAKLKREIERRERAERRAELEAHGRRHQERRASAYKGIVTKTKKRIHNGVCPYCHRTFSALQRHMKTKHGK